MVQERPTLAFRWLLPITQLVVSVVVLWPLHMILIQQVRLSIRAYRHQPTPLSHLPEDQQFRILEVPLSPQEQLELERFESLEKREWVPIMLNLPSGLALFLFCTVIAIGIPICAGMDKDFPMKLFVAGSGAWAVLGGMMVAARVAQWRIIRGQEGLSNSPAVSPA